MWKKILYVTLLAGTLDILAAFLNAYLSSGVLPGRVLQYIASGVFGKKAFTGGNEMMVWGLIFHFLIAFFCVLVFFLSYPRLKFLHGKMILNAFLIGTVAWLVTNLLVIPFSKVPPAGWQWENIIKGWLILVFCIGGPVSWMGAGYWDKEQLTS
jgi:hypothetical protein